MSTKNGVPFRQWLVPSSKYSLKAPYSMTPKKITIHNTDNQMPANNEISYMRNNDNATSYHVAIDEKEAIQGLPYNRNGFHAGDGKNGYGNRHTIGIEICRNYDRTRNTTNLNEPLKSQFDKAVQNTIKFVAQLCIDLGIVANKSNIKKHQDWSGKYCPSKILRDGKWDWLVNEIIKEYNRLKSGGKPNSSTPTNKNWLEKGDKGSEVVALQKNLIALGYNLGKYGADGSFGNDTELALRKFQSDYRLAVDGLYGQDSKKAMEKALKGKVGELTVSQYEKLLKLIEGQNNEINKLKKALENRDSQIPSPSHQDALEWAKKQGLTNGQNPLHPVLREQVFTMFKRFYEEFINHSDEEVSKAFAEAVDWAIENEISTGIRPRDFAKRDEVLMIIYSFYKYLKKEEENRLRRKEW